MKRWWPEALLVSLALAAFLGCLGSVELWGKREQRAAAEAIDTVDHDHWLVAQIQGRPRLEKPPLPRWSIPALMKLTGCRDERIVRLPSAISGILTVALIYALGLRMAGRELALASGLVLCSMGFFVGEMRQAGNDAPLVLFTTLALYAAWRCFLGGPAVRPGCPGQSPRAPVFAFRTGARSKTRSAPATRLAQLILRCRLAPDRHPFDWRLVFYIALGLGFLTKGPVILLLVAATIIPYLVINRQVSIGLRRLASLWGMLAFLTLAMSWPAAVLVENPAAPRVWMLEMTEKTGLSQILEHRPHAPVVADWPAMMLPWTLIALVAVIWPFLKPEFKSSQARDLGSQDPPRTPAFLWYAWCWAVGNLVLLCLWSVAKPSYYDPCLPGMALLIGATWVELAKIARGRTRVAIAARGILQLQWVSLFVAALIAPLVVREWAPAEVMPWCGVIALAFAVGITVSVYSWRRGVTALTLAPLATACALGFVLAYGRIAPEENSARSHRLLAQKLRAIVPADSPTIMFFNEIDEGLWFYSHGLNLAPIPGSQPQFNTAFDLAHRYLADRGHTETLAKLEARRLAQQKQALVDWFDRGDSDPRPGFVLIRRHLFDLFAADLAGRAPPIFRETAAKRNELVLLQVSRPQPMPAANAARETSTRR